MARHSYCSLSACLPRHAATHTTSLRPSSDNSSATASTVPIAAATTIESAAEPSIPGAGAPDARSRRAAQPGHLANSTAVARLAGRGPPSSAGTLARAPDQQDWTRHQPWCG